MLALSRKVDELILIGDDLLVGPTDIEPKMVRLVARGRLMGGAGDGETVSRAADLGVGGEMRLGAHVVVTIIDIRGDQVRLGVQVPNTISVHRKEVYDAIVRDLHRGRGDDTRH